MRAIWAIGLGVVLGCGLSTARAQELRGEAAPSSGIPAVTLLTPVVSLGRPVPRVSAALTPASFTTDGADGHTPIVRAQSADPPPPAPVPYSQIPAAPPGPPPTAILPPVAPPPGDPLGVGVPGVPPPSPGFWDRCQQFLHLDAGSFQGNGHRLFQSDHAFDGFISPITDPFYFEDPRALTEVRPIFMLQGAPDKNPIYHGGDIEYFGLQARLAVTERLSFVLSELGWVWLEAHHPADDLGTHSGFAEIKLGPKYTFLRCEDTCTVGAVGLNFEIPAGPGKVAQDTGNLSLTPYVSLAQSFGKTSYGSFNTLGTLGYAFSVDNERTDQFFMNLHLDFDVGGFHKIYPLMELNWINYAHAGTSRNLGFEGGDLVNFGSHGVSGHNELYLAFGARYKFSEMFQVGTAVQFPIINTNNLLDYRLTFDLILRY
jgi:hypothetical protein